MRISSKRNSHDEQRYSYVGILSLPLLESWVLLVDDVSLALSDNDLAIFGASFDATMDFHNQPLDKVYNMAKQSQVDYAGHVGVSVV